LGRAWWREDQAPGYFSSHDLIGFCLTAAAWPSARLAFAETALQVLAKGGSLRISMKGVVSETMVQYAAAARQGGARLTFVVGKAMLMPDIMIQIAEASQGVVVFDLVDEA